VRGQSAFRHTISRGVLTFSTAVLLTGIVVLYRFEAFSEQIQLLMSYQGPGLGKWKESFVSTFVFQIHPFITLLAIASLWTAFGRRDPKYLIIAWLPLLLIIFQIKRIRYTIPLFPMVTLMASYGLQQIGDRDLKRFIALCIIMSSIAVGLFAYLPFTQKMSAANLKKAGEFLNTLDENAVEVFTVLPKEPVVNPAVEVPLLDLYTRKRIIYHGEFSAPPGRDIIASPLRFTWEYKNPPYYALEDRPRDEEKAVVILSGEGGGDLPSTLVQRLKDYHLVSTFNADEGVFQHKTFVSVYRQRTAALKGKSD